MNESDDFERTVSEWKHKHRLRDDDPVLAAIELLKLFFKNVKIELPADSESATLIEVRASMQQLNHLGRDFSKQTRELIQELREVPKLKQRLFAGRAAAFAFTAISSAVAGILIGKYLL
jgi:hypothetical protein